MDYKKIFKNRELRLKLINCLRFIPAKPYLKLVYRIKAGKKLNLKNPATFCDKQNWLQLNEIHPEYTELVDKVGVREYIKEILGEEYLFPVYGIICIMVSDKREHQNSSITSVFDNKKAILVCSCTGKICGIRL